MERLDKTIVTQINRAVSIYSQKGRSVKISNRDCYGLSFCVDGQITYVHNGVNFVSKPNVAIILPIEQSYSLFGNKAGTFPLIDFQTDTFLCDTFVTIPLENPDSFIRDFERIKTLLLFGEANSQVFSIFYSMLHRLANQNKEDVLLLPAIKYIERNFSNPDITNSTLASLCNISEVYFRKLFFKTYNITPKQFIIDARINNAKQLLSQGNMKIGSIAEACGFSSQYHFTRLFHEKIGVTPSAYMSENLIKKI